jgi:hypothetical protein
MKPWADFQEQYQKMMQSFLPTSGRSDKE